MNLVKFNMFPWTLHIVGNLSVPRHIQSKKKGRMDYLDGYYGMIKKWQQVGVIEQWRHTDFLPHQIQLLLALYQHLLHGKRSILWGWHKKRNIFSSVLCTVRRGIEEPPPIWSQHLKIEVGEASGYVSEIKEWRILVLKPHTNPSTTHFGQISRTNPAHTAHQARSLRRNHELARGRGGTWDAGSVAPGGRGVGGGLVLPDEVDEGKASLADLAEDAEAALVDPDVAAARRGVVEGVEPGDGAAHPPAYSRTPLLAAGELPRGRPPDFLNPADAVGPVVWFRRSAASTRTVTWGSSFSMWWSDPIYDGQTVAFRSFKMDWTFFCWLQIKTT